MALGPIIGEVPSDTPGHPPYAIRLGRDMRVYCACDSWKYSPAPKGCKHLPRFFAAIVAAANAKKVA
jgi:hypothetical protein